GRRNGIVGPEPWTGFQHEAVGEEAGTDEKSRHQAGYAGRAGPRQPKKATPTRQRQLRRPAGSPGGRRTSGSRKLALRLYRAWTRSAGHLRQSIRPEFGR